MKTIVTFKAQPITADEPTDDCNIEMVCRAPEYKTLGEQDAAFRAEAVEICNALYNHLPGGLFDQLLGEMLSRKASHFRVSHAA